MIEYVIHLIILVGIYLILSLSLQISMGFTGIFNIGHIGFYGIGAYVSALLVLSGVPFWISILASATISMCTGFVLSIPGRGLKRENFALLGMAFALILYYTSLNWIDVTGGPRGLSGIPKPTIFGISFSDNVYFLSLVLPITAISYFAIHRIVHSPFGRVLQAIRDDELAVRTLGKNTFKVKGMALGSSAFFAGIAGSMYAHYISYISPSLFSLASLIPAFLIIILGGLASLRGTLVATLIIVTLPELIVLINLPYSIVGPIQQLIYAFVLLLILMFRPRGIYGKLSRL